MRTKQALTPCIAGLAGLACSAGAIAHSDTPQDKRFYVTPMVSYGFFDSDTVSGTKKYGQDNSFNVHNDDSIGVSLAIGKPINKWLNLEAFGFYFDPKQKLNGADAHHADLYGFGLDALFFPARDALPVYGILGGSWGKLNPGYRSINRVDTEGSNADTHFMDAGIGYMYTLNDYGLKVRAEYRYRYTSIDMSDVLGADYNNERHNDHIISLGLQIPLGAPPQVKPQPEPVMAAPESEPAEKPAPIALKGVTFRFDSSELTAQAHHRLNNVVGALDANPDVDFRIDGYTDSIGSLQYNRGLSKRRAHSVKSYLTGHGIKKGRITDIQGHGENNPVAPNTKSDGSDNPAGRAKNRRVELTASPQDD
jgi:OOP family OmpA-OmpF porin